MVITSPLHYPPQPAAGGGESSEARIGPGAHSDYGCLALLAQDDRDWLQVRNAAGRWIDANPVPGTLIAHLQERFGATLSYLDESLVERERTSG